MKRIMYASGGFVTDDGVADALMDYAGVLAIVGSADVVSCPGVDHDGALRGVQLLIGPSSQILAMDCDDPHVAMDAESAIGELRSRAEERLPKAFDTADPPDTVDVEEGR